MLDQVVKGIGSQIESGASSDLASGVAVQVERGDTKRVGVRKQQYDMTANAFYPPGVGPDICYALPVFSGGLRGETASFFLAHDLKQETTT